MDKSKLTEREICSKSIMPAIEVDKLNIPFVFSSNGNGFLIHDKTNPLTFALLVNWMK